MVILVISEVIPVILVVIPVIPVIPGNRDTVRRPELWLENASQKLVI